MCAPPRSPAGRCTLTLRRTRVLRLSAPFFRNSSQRKNDYSWSGFSALKSTAAGWSRLSASLTLPRRSRCNKSLGALASQVPLARTGKFAVSMPVVAVGLITGIEQDEAIVGTGDADMIALARTILYDPRWPWHAAAELGAQVRARKQYLRVPSRDSTRICSRIGRRLGHRTDCRVRPRARVARMRRNPHLQRRPSSSPTHSSESTLSGESSTDSASAHPFLNPAEHLRESSPRTTFRIRNVSMSRPD